MSSKAMSLKAKIRNYAVDNKIAAQAVLQNMWSKYQQKYPYAQGIRYDEIMDVLRELLL